MTDWLKNISKKVGLKIIINMTKKLQKIGHPDDDVIFLKRPQWKYLKTLLVLKHTIECCGHYKRC